MKRQTLPLNTSPLSSKESSNGYSSTSLAPFAPYFAYFRLSFLKMLAYRLRYYTGIITYLLFVSVQYFIWQAVFAAKPMESSIQNFRLSEISTYVALGWIARSFYHSNIDHEIHSLVRTGQISLFLMRPLNFQGLMISQALGESSFRLFCFSLPIGIVIASIYPVLPPASFTAAFAFLLSTLLGFLILIQINFLVGLLAFPFQSVEGLIRAKQNLIQLFSGLLLPLSFFPTWLSLPLQFLPFQDIASTPLLLYLGKLQGSDLLFALLRQCSWILILSLLAALGWRRSLRHLSIQGG